MQGSQQPAAESFWAKPHPVETRKERVQLFEELIATLKDMIGTRNGQITAYAYKEQTKSKLRDLSTLIALISYYNRVNDNDTSFRLSEDYLIGRKNDPTAVKTYVEHLTKQREAQEPEAMVRKLYEAEVLLKKARFKKADAAHRDELLLDIKLCIAEHMPHRDDKERILKQAIEFTNECLDTHIKSKGDFLWKKATLYSELGALQRKIQAKVDAYLESLKTLYELNEIDQKIDFTNIILINFEDLLSIAQTDDECKEMIEIIEKPFTPFINGGNTKRPAILHNIAWLYYKKACTTNYDAEREYYIKKSEYFLKRKDNVFIEAKATPKGSNNLRAHLANLKAENEQTEIKKLHYLYDSIDLYQKAQEEDPEQTAVFSYIASAYLKLAQEENDVFKRLNLIEKAIKQAQISSRVGIDVTYAYKVLSKAYRMMEEIHTDNRQKELYHAKKVQYEELLH